MKSRFIWADLSTFDLSAAKHFYQQCFGWQYQPLEADYELCQAEQNMAAGLYTMPEKFQRIKMPAFWMSYIQVGDIEQTVRQAERCGARIEVKPEPGPGGGRIALIRDPAGAGFTCYEGESLIDRGPTDALGDRVWHELHVSNLEPVKSFYEALFGWIIRASGTQGRYEIFASADEPEPMAGIQVTPNAIKGDKEYWGVYFSVASLEDATKSIERAGGEIVAEQPLGERFALLAYDSQGAAFYLVEGGLRSGVGDSDKATGIAQPKWRALLGLLVVAAAVLLEANWLWGVLFLLWVIPDIKYGVTHFMEVIERRENPVVYWLIIATWVCLAVYLLVESLVSS